MMTGTYEIIYADPPWRYSAKKVQGAAENHYPTMSIDELCALPVAELAAKDSALFMWATFPQLPEALRLIRAWGFTYKASLLSGSKRTKRRIAGFMAGLLDAGQRRGLPAGDQGTPQAAGRRYSPIYHFSHRGPQQKAGRGPRQNHFPDGRSAPRGALCQADPARLGCMGE